MAVASISWMAATEVAVCGLDCSPAANHNHTSVCERLHRLSSCTRECAPHAVGLRVHVRPAVPYIHGERVLHLYTPSAPRSSTIFDCGVPSEASVSSCSCLVSSRSCDVGSVLSVDLNFSRWAKREEARAKRVVEILVASAQGLDPRFLLSVIAQ